MINRIRDIRRSLGLTLADVGARCDPPTTAQTIGRLETGTRTLSLGWMNRIADALGVDPQVLVRPAQDAAPRLIASLAPSGAEALAAPQEAVPPTELVGQALAGVLAVEASAGEYRAGDQVWLSELLPEDFARALNRDVLAPRPAGRFAFGRLIDINAGRIALLPPGAGSRQLVIDRPAWLGVATVLVRRL